MSKAVSISVGVMQLPEALREDVDALRGYVRACIKTAVELRLEPDLSAASGRERKSVLAHLTGGEAAFLQGLMRKQGVTLPSGLAAGRLAEAAMAMTPLPMEIGSGGQSGLMRVLELTRPGSKPRDEQAALYANLSKSLGTGLEAGPIVAAQASTGVGKTAIAQALVLDQLDRDPASVCVVTFPSLNGVKVLASEWHRMRMADGGGQIPELAVLFGRGEYVSEDALTEVADKLEQEGDKERADTLREWMRAQEQIGAGELVPAWMMDALLSVDDQLDRDELSITAASRAEDCGVVSYKKQFEKSEAARVVACSHTMLALDILMRWRSLSGFDGFRAERKALSESYFSEVGKTIRAAQRESGERARSFEEVVADICMEHELAIGGTTLASRRLPRYDFIVIDEAHMLEQAFSNVFSRSVSLNVTAGKLERLRSLAWRGSKGQLEAARDAVSWVVEGLAEMCADGEEVRIGEPDGKSREAADKLRFAYSKLKALNPPPEGCSALVGWLWDGIRRDTETLRQMVDEKFGGQKWISFTPVRRYPHLVVGSGNVKQPLNVLWAGVREAALLSATLYLQKNEGWSARYCCSTLLAVPPTRVAEIPVVEAAWLYKPVTGLFIPERRTRPNVKDGHWLCPTPRKEKLKPEAMERRKALWLAEVSQACEWAYRTGAGGALVLCTSIEVVNELGRMLKEQLGDDVPVLLSTKLRSLKRLRDEALKQVLAGKRPLLVGTGGAWTGFDVSGGEQIAAEKDNVITDLVMTRVPFGMNRSLTHRARMEGVIQDRMLHESTAAAIMGRQGVGRLVRREGLKRNRRIFMLDGRLRDPGPISGSLALFKNMLAGYPQKVLLLNELTAEVEA